MADQKVSDLPSLNGADVDPADLFYIVDSSAGTAGSKKITIGQFQLSPWSAGTVNGVLYFDGSKVPVSSPALTFDGTTLSVGAGAYKSTNGANAVFLGAAGQINFGAGGSDLVLATNGANVRFGNWNTNTEFMRLDTSGNFLLGTSSNVNNYKTHILTSDTAAAVGIFQNNPTTPYGINVYYGAASPNNSNANTSFLYCNDLTTLRIQLASNGGVINYQANDSNLSDRREKTDFAPAKSYLDTICAIPVQTFKYIDQTDDARTLGVVAQDVQTVAPELVMESNWGTEDEPKMRLSIYQTDLQYALMKSIQELKMALDEANARIAKLEAK